MGTGVSAARNGMANARQGFINVVSWAGAYNSSVLEFIVPSLVYIKAVSVRLAHHHSFCLRAKHSPSAQQYAGHRMSMPHVDAPCRCPMSMPHVDAPCRCPMSMPRVDAACRCPLSPAFALVRTFASYQPSALAECRRLARCFAACVCACTTLRLVLAIGSPDDFLL